MRLRELRVKAGMTQQQLAEKVNQTKSTISKYERGALEPSNELLKRFSDIFGVTVDFLLEGSVSHNLKVSETDKPTLEKVIIERSPTPLPDDQKKALMDLLDSTIDTFLKAYNREQKYKRK